MAGYSLRVMEADIVGSEGIKVICCVEQGAPVSKVSLKYKESRIHVLRTKQSQMKILGHFEVGGHK